MQEEWVKRWLDKLTPKQQLLVTEVLKDVNKYRKPTLAAVAQAEAAVANSNQPHFYIYTDTNKAL